MLEVRHASTDRKIRKPLIIAEGLDTGIITLPESPAGENNLEDFRGSYRNILPNLRDKFNEYDIIYVNWANGLDYIENNAEVLKEVIRMVNRVKVAAGSTEKNVVLGQSMGGLVARYALKDMEDKGEDHGTRLYISHDAPHQGANSPLSVQYFLRHLRKIVIRNPLVYTTANSILPLFNNGKAGYDYYNILDNPATRQMMINWVNKDYRIDNSFHTNWQAKLKAKGYPKKTRNVAIANGNVCGNFQNVASSILQLNKEFSYHAFEDFLTSIIAGQHSNVPLAVLAHFPGKQTYRFNANCKPVLRNRGGSNIYEGKISYRKKIFWLLPVTVTLADKKISQKANLLPYDELPGSVFNLSRGSLPEALKDITQNPSSFIPNISALDYGKGNINHSQSAYENVIYRNNNKIPFDAYILERENREHISFSADNSTWLINELDKNTHTATDLALSCTKDKHIVGAPQSKDM